MKKFLMISLIIFISGCSADSALMFGTSPEQSLDLMKGTGTTFRNPDGTTTFRWVILVNAYATLIDSDSQLREQHDWLISSFVGTNDICPAGYTVSEPTVEVGTFVYNGTCN
jgi:hypothetical protein